MSRSAQMLGTQAPIQTKASGLPLLVKIVLCFTILACVGNTFLAELPLSGLGWFVPLIFAFSSIVRMPGSIKFPYMLWVPWAAYVLFYLIDSDAPNALQRSIMLLCPIIVGMAVSALTFGDQEFSAFRKAYKYMAIIFMVGILFKGGVLLTGALPSATPFAAEVMTTSLLCCIFAANYSFGRSQDLFWWAALAMIPVIAVTRMGMLATGISLPFTMAPLNLAKRVLLIALMLIAGVVVFNTERVQQKSFYGGSGTLKDVRLENPDFATSGRSAMWDALEYEIGKEPWFGHGANATEPFVARITGGLTHPHNDWLRLQYDYGYVGTIMFGLTLLAQMIHALKRGRQSTGDTRTLFYVGISSFVIFSLFMFTDNIILYAAFFGNLQFTILGMAYASYDSHKTGPEPKKIRITW